MDIRNEILQIDTEECDALADRFFLEASGIDRPGPKYERMRREAFEIRERIRERVRVRAIYSYYSQVDFSGDTAIIGGKAFRCNAFALIPREQVYGAFVHLVTAGEYYLDGEPIMNQLFADLWGSAFTEAGRILLLSRLEGERALSEEFGPGFYGMESIQMKDLAGLLDAGAIGVETRATGILVPVKSCGGISFRVGDGYLRLSAECADCRGNRSGCAQCSVRINLNNRENGEKEPGSAKKKDV